MSNHLNVLVFSYVYPPDAGSGTYRTLYFFNNISMLDVGVTIITVDRGSFHRNASIDNELSSKVHSDIDVIRTPVARPFEKMVKIKNRFTVKKCTNSPKSCSANYGSGKPQFFLRSVKDLISGLLATPDEHIGWIFFALRAARQITKTKKIHCLYATGGPWSCILAASIFKFFSQLPLVLDFRDPWVENPNFSGKLFFLKKIEMFMEWFCVKMATSIVANTEELRLDFMKRYSFLKEKNLYTITNGYEHIIENKTSNFSKEFTIVHAGELYMSRNPEQFLIAIEDIIRSNLIPKKDLKVKLIGGITVNSKSIDRILTSKHLEGVVMSIPRVNHKEIINEQSSADVLLVIQIGFPLQIPRKLYEYLSFSKCILAITEDYGATASIIKKHSLGRVVNNEKESIKLALVSMYEQWKNRNNEYAFSVNSKEFDNKILSRQLLDILHRESGLPR